MSSRPTAVIIVEDDPVLRPDLVAQVSAAEGFVVEGAAADLRSALGLIRASRPAIVLLDLGLPDGSGLDLVGPCRARGHECLVLTVHDDERSVFSAIERGAVGYVLKAQGAPALRDALAATRAGESYVSPRIARRLLAAMGPPSEPSAAATLTPRELEVIELFCRGLTYAEVAGVCGISVNTVRTHVRQSYEKLQVSSKAEAVSALLSARART